jgi:predicted O-methyltransferase YrrM
VTGGGSSIPEVQALLRVLASGRRCAEIGTAFGEGAAAMSDTAASLVTVEIDAERAAVAQERLRDRDNVELFVGDWKELLPSRAPFELLFFDGGKFAEAADSIDLVGPGGLLVKDDLTPDWPGPDPVRELLFGHAELVAVELLTTPRTPAIVAAKRVSRRTP